MKAFILLLLVFVSSAAVAAEGSLVTLDAPRIRAIAVSSIRTKYPEIDSSKLVFDSIQYSLSASNADVIRVTYQVPSSAETKKHGSAGVHKVTTKAESISVQMSTSGKVENVSKGSSVRTSIKPE